MNFLSTGISQPSAYFVAEPSAREPPRPTVYLDTSIPSYLTARLRQDFLVARRQRITRIWWSRYRRHFDLRISDYVAAESAAGNPLAAMQRMNALATIEVLAKSERSLRLVEHLMGKGRLPSNARVDAEHISIAAAYSVRFLLTWNYEHLANDTIARNVARTCESLGYRCPEICTPEKLMRIFAHERSFT
jgi:hypothetical protein